MSECAIWALWRQLTCNTTVVLNHTVALWLSVSANECVGLKDNARHLTHDTTHHTVPDVAVVCSGEKGASLYCTVLGRQFKG